MTDEEVLRRARIARTQRRNWRPDGVMRERGSAEPTGRNPCRGKAFGREVRIQAPPVVPHGEERGTEIPASG